MMRTKFFLMMLAAIVMGSQVTLFAQEKKGAKSERRQFNKEQMQHSLIPLLSGSQGGSLVEGLYDTCLCPFNGFLQPADGLRYAGSSADCQSNKSG